MKADSILVFYYVNSGTNLNNDQFFSPYIVESYPHQKEKSFNNYL